MSIQALYTDIDGTLVGPGGDLFLDGDSKLSLAAAVALMEVREAGIQLIGVSGRDQRRMREIGRLTGMSAWICELGGVQVIGNSVTMSHGEYPRDDTPVEGLLPAFHELIAAFPDQLEEHKPWNELREISLMLRGNLDIATANTWLHDNNYPWAELRENSRLTRLSLALPQVKSLHIYHLAPRGVNKFTGIQNHQKALGLSPAECAYVGDSAEDLTCAPLVAQLFIVANGVERNPQLAENLPPNASVTAGSYGQGFAEATQKIIAAQ